VEVFYKLASRDGKRGRERDVRILVDIVKKERVDIWVNCHGGRVDLEVKEVLERETGCKVLQFPTAGMKLLGDEVVFAEHVKKLGLNVAERHPVTSEEEIPAILYPAILEPSKENWYTVMSASTNDTTSSEMTLLLLSSPNNIKGCLKTLQPSSHPPRVLPQSPTIYCASPHSSRKPSSLHRLPNINNPPHPAPIQLSAHQIPLAIHYPSHHLLSIQPRTQQ